MKRVIHNIIYLLAGVLSAGCVSCTQAELLEPEQPDSPAAFECVGTPVDATLDLSVVGLSAGLTTKGDGPVDDTQAERSVRDIWVFQYDADGSKLVSAPFYMEISADNQAILSNISVKDKLTDNAGDPCIVYVVANTGNSAWVPTEPYAGFTTIADLEGQIIPSPDPIYAADDSWVIPMGGSCEEVTIENGTVVKVPVKRMYAKLMIHIDLNIDNASLYNIDVGNIPWYCEVSALADDENAAEYPSGTRFISRSFLPADESDTEYYPYVIYVPESLHGVVEESESKTVDNAPANSLVVNVDVNCTDEEGGVTTYPYSFYPGGNVTDNFNIKRNCVYYIDITINDLSETLVPSSNCFSVAPGETLAFYPYYRIETGGDYDFTDYLDPDDETGEKVISYVKIIWQTQNCIGNNDPTQGGEQLVWTSAASSDHELYRKIYVKAQSEGNALIGAYNENDEILWSWHIWVNTHDAANVANGILYYTYDWDENGIKAYKDADGNIIDSPLVPGRTVMRCGLGALSLTPSSRGDMSTFGMLYQWGRKDPFPPLNVQYKNGYSADADYDDLTIYPDVMGYDITNTRKRDYTEENTQTLYDNAHKADIGMTAGYKSDVNGKTPVFYSIAGTDVSTLDNPVLYTVRNPCVFLCGTEEAKYGTVDSEDGNDDYNYVNDAKNYHSQGDWDDISDDCLWGGTSYTEAEKKYFIGEGYNNNGYYYSITLYDDYGPDKTIFDPCPFGWRVSPPDLWLGFTSTGMNVTSDEDLNWNEGESVKFNGMSMFMQGWRNNGETSFFPTQGPRTPDGCGIRVGTCGNFHNATVGDQNRVNILHVHDDRRDGFSFMIFETYNYMFYVKSCGAQVRCVREAE